MNDVQKQLTRNAPVARRKSLLHLAKRMLETAGKLKGCILVWNKAKAYHKEEKPKESVCKALSSAIDQAKTKSAFVDYVWELFTLRASRLGLALA